MTPYYYGVYYGYGNQGYGGGRGQFDIGIWILERKEFFQVVVVADVAEVVFDNEEEEIIKKINLRITVKKKKWKVNWFEIDFQ